MLSPFIVVTTPAVISGNNKNGIVLISRCSLYPIPEFSDHPVYFCCLFKVKIILSIMCKFICFTKTQINKAGLMLAYIFFSGKKGQFVVTSSLFSFNDLSLYFID